MIKILDSFIADKIAAGEVIERPVSIVKELVENSIDAGSDSIIVEIKNGGKTYLRVTDTGCGIPSDEVEIAFERHATSKISNVQDLENIQSLGFRGEALASIAAVSRLTIVTKTADSSAGTKLVMHGGRKVSLENVGTNIGTTIVIEDVFYNIPARRKFMGSDAREASAIIELIEHYAICYANIRFMLINNGNTIFTTEGNDNILSSIKAVYPTKEYSNLLELNSDNVKGYVSDPGTTKTSRRGQLFFVNGRLVDSKIIEKGIEKGYNGRIFSGYPIAILFITADPADLDVNIHPGKKEIKFLHEDEIINSIATAISDAMSRKDSIPSVDTDRIVAKERNVQYEPPKQERFVARETATLEPGPKPEVIGDIRTFLTEMKRETAIETVDEEIAPPLNSTGIDSNDIIFTEEVRNIPSPAPFTFEGLHLMGYIFNTYIIMQKESDIFVFDQHAAHERIFYEKFMNRYNNTEQLPQPIISPLIINVSPDVYAADRCWMEPLAKIGYDISDFGSDTFIIRGIPSFMDLFEAEAFASTFIENADDYSNNTTVIDKLIMKSCKSAVKANEKLSGLEIEELMNQLAQCDNPFCCPHGRPTFIKLNKYDVEKAFKRK